MKNIQEKFYQELYDFFTEIYSSEMTGDIMLTKDLKIKLGKLVQMDSDISADMADNQSDEIYTNKMAEREERISQAYQDDRMYNRF